MRRKLSTLLLLAALAVGAGSTARAGNFMSGQWSQGSTDGETRISVRYGREAPGMVGPYGTPITARPNTMGSSGAPSGADYARAMISQSHPASMLQLAGYNPGALQCGPGGCPPGMGGMPGPMMPGVGPGGPSPAAMNSAAYNGPAGAVAMVPGPGGPAGGGGPPFGSFRTEIRFVGPAGMKISWYAPKQDGKAGFTTQYLEAPARYNFVQAAIYRLKLSDIPGRPGVELYPTLDIVPANHKTTTFIAHAAVPVNFTEEDLEQVAAGNFIVKVIYLPDPQFQDLAATGPDEVVSSRLEPGVDPIMEAKRRGSILAIVRLGNIDLEAPNTPAMDAPGDGAAAPHGPIAPPPGAARMMMPTNMPPMVPGMPRMPMMPGMGLPGMPPLPGMNGPVPGGVPVKTGTPAASVTVPSPVQPVSAKSNRMTNRSSFIDLLGKSGGDR